MSTLTIVLLVILIILIGALIALYFFGKKAQKKQEEQQAQIEAAKQTVSMLIIDKKRLPLKESGLPQMVIDQAPKLMRRSKLPIVKAKVGPKISVLIADEKVFDLIPVKKEVKAEVSGLYIVGVKGIRVPLRLRLLRKKASSPDYVINNFIRIIKQTPEGSSLRVFVFVITYLFFNFHKKKNLRDLLTVPEPSGNSLPHVLHSYPVHNPLSFECGLHPP